MYIHTYISSRRRAASRGSACCVCLESDHGTAQSSLDQPRATNTLHTRDPSPPLHSPSLHKQHSQWIHSPRKGVCLPSSLSPSLQFLLTNKTPSKELLTIHNAFHSGLYTTVLDTDTSALSPDNVTAARVYALRARIALGQTSKVIAELEGETDIPDLAAVTAFAEYTEGEKETAVTAIEGLVESAGDNATVQVMAATVLQLEGRSDEALAVLAKHQGSLEA